VVNREVQELMLMKGRSKFLFHLAIEHASVSFEPNW
jgi:hypothetical protein